MAVVATRPADALFGKRSEVQDPHDRYANLEIGYLLQRIEEHTGTTVLATNRVGDLDEAFIRRFHFINLIRKFDIGGILVWGARTLPSDLDLKYINVRRMLIFIEASINLGTQWAVFEPNALPTWVTLTDSVSAFLLTLWRSGALFGDSPEQAFFVRCDETTMTAEDT